MTALHREGGLRQRRSLR